LLARAGYFVGEHLYPPDSGNPKGYFEDPAVNGLNEALLEQVLPQWPAGQRWLVPAPADAAYVASSALRRQMARFTARRPYCLKDPRFASTLDAWRPVLADSNPVFICLFRRPAATAQSLLAHTRRVPVLQEAQVTPAQALQVWRAAYERILGVHLPAGGDWRFVEYQQVLYGDGVDRLEEWLGVTLDRDFVDPQLERAHAAAPVPGHVADLYAALSALAERSNQQPRARVA
jgi:hypothetical protein